MKIRYPIEKMVFGLASSRHSLPVEGDDVYTTPSLGRLYGDKQAQQPQSPYRRRAFKPSNQYDVSVNNDFVVATSLPIAVKTAAYMPRPQGPQGPLAGPQGPQGPQGPLAGPHGPQGPQGPKGPLAGPQGPSAEQQQRQQHQGQDDVEINQQGEQNQSPQYGSPSWYEKINSKLNAISQEAFTFMQSGLSVVTDFSSLYVPTDMRRANLTRLFSQYRQQSTFADLQSFSLRDEARQLLEEYLSESDLSMLPPPIVLEEQARCGYYRSIFFNTSRIESQGTGKVVLPRTKPYSTWLASGFSLSPKSGLSVAQPIRLPTNQGLFILGSLPQQVQIGEHILLTYGINNYLGKDLSNVVVRIRASADFDLIEQAQPERIASSNGKDYTITIPSLRTLGVETRNIVLVPKRAGVVKILLEVESEFGGDYEVLTTFVRESGIERRQISARLFDLTSGKKTYGPIVEKITPSPFLRSVRISVSGKLLSFFDQKR